MGSGPDCRGKAPLTFLLRITDMKAFAPALSGDKVLRTSLGMFEYRCTWCEFVNTVVRVLSATKKQ